MLLAWQEIFYFYAYQVGPAKKFPGRVYLFFVTNETEVIAVWKNSQIRENGHISKIKMTKREKMCTYLIWARVYARLQFFCSGEWRPSALYIPKCWPKN